MPRSLTLTFPFLQGFLARRSALIGLSLAGLYSVLLAVLSFKYHTIGDYGVETDFYVFVSQAKLILEGGFPIDGARGPVYFLLLAAAGFLTSDFFSAGLFFGLISAGIVLYLTYRLLCDLYRDDIALVVTALTAANPIFIQHTYSSGTDMVFCAIATAAVYYYLRHERLKHMHLVVAGVLAGLAYLTRYNGVFLIAGLFLGILTFDAARLGKGRKALSCALLLVVFALTITPWGVYCLQEKGDFFYNTNYRNIAYGLYGEGKMDWDAFWGTRAEDFRSFLDVFLEGPGLFLKTMFFNVYRHFVNDLGDLLGWHLGVLVLPGMVITVLGRPKSKRAVYLLLNVLLFAVLLTVFYNPRFSLFLVPVYGLLAVQTFDWIAKAYSGAQKLMSWLIPAAALSLVLWTAVEAYEFNKKNISQGPHEILVIADWFDMNVPAEHKGSVIVARKPHIAYYLDLEFNWIPDVRTYDELIAGLRDVNADYLYFSYIEAHWRPDLAYLLNAEEKYPGLMPMLFMKNPKAVLYMVEAE
jgi:4-amino-4-deoxy-L-arabinose transferase-like glycosyltransferase